MPTWTEQLGAWAASAAEAAKETAVQAGEAVVEVAETGIEYAQEGYQVGTNIVGHAFDGNGMDSVAMGVTDFVVDNPDANISGHVMTAVTDPNSTEASLLSRVGFSGGSIDTFLNTAFQDPGSAPAYVIERISSAVADPNSPLTAWFSTEEGANFTSTVVENFNADETTSTLSEEMLGGFQNFLTARGISTTAILNSGIVNQFIENPDIQDALSDTLGFDFTPEQFDAFRALVEREYGGNFVAALSGVGTLMEPNSELRTELLGRIDDTLYSMLFPGEEGALSAQEVAENWEYFNTLGEAGVEGAEYGEILGFAQTVYSELAADPSISAETKLMMHQSVSEMLAIMNMPEDQRPQLDGKYLPGLMTFGAYAAQYLDGEQAQIMLQQLGLDDLDKVREEHGATAALAVDVLANIDDFSPEERAELANVLSNSLYPAGDGESPDPLALLGGMSGSLGTIQNLAASYLDPDLPDEEYERRRKLMEDALDEQVNSKLGEMGPFGGIILFLFEAFPQFKEAIYGMVLPGQEHEMDDPRPEPPDYPDGTIPGSPEFEAWEAENRAYIEELEAWEARQAEGEEMAGAPQNEELEEHIARTEAMEAEAAEGGAAESENEPDAVAAGYSPTLAMGPVMGPQIDIEPPPVLRGDATGSPLNQSLVNAENAQEIEAWEIEYERVQPVMDNIAFTSTDWGVFGEVAGALGACEMTHVTGDQLCTFAPYIGDAGIARQTTIEAPGGGAMMA